MNLNKALVLLVFAFALTIALATSFGTSRAASTLVVDDNLACPGALYTSIQAAVNVASPGDTIQVCAGTYNENVTIPNVLPNLTVNGAQDGNPFAGRTFAGPGESTLTGQITIHATGVTVDGFSLTNPGAAFGIVVKGTGNNAVIQNNIIDTVGSATLAGGGGAQGIYLENGPDNVSILDNLIRNIQSVGSAKGVLIGDSLASDPSLNTLVEGNTIEDISSGTRGAYGVQVNNGSSTVPAATGYTEITVRDNVIDDLNGGGWAHAIGLEGDTPVAIVQGNCISDVVDLTPSPVNDAIAVFFEANPSFSLGEVHQNNFTGVEYGIAVHPSLVGSPVDGENNWWGSASGPGPVGPGTGAKVSPNVDYTPWLIAPALGGACGGAEATTAGQCKNGGWMTVFRANGTSFKNQGDCMQYVNTGK